MHNMARTPKSKKLKNSRLLKEYASWAYCTSCNKTVAYLCYVTYDLFDFEYTCGCGNCGEVHIEFEHDTPKTSSCALSLVKNRLCCPDDASPLVTVVDKNLAAYKFRILCNTCGTLFSSDQNNAKG